MHFTRPYNSNNFQDFNTPHNLCLRSTLEKIRVVSLCIQIVSMTAELLTKLCVSGGKTLP